MISALLLQAPAETTRYMAAGYLVIFSVMSLYIVSLIVRSRRLKQEMGTLKELEQEKK